MTSNTPLRTSKLACGYEGRVVIDDLTFDVRAGEILALVGPNGAGKSTVLKTIANLLQAVSGSVFYHDASLAEMTPAEIAKTVGIVTTNRLRGERMTCFDVVATGRYPYTGRLGMLSETDRAVVREAMRLLHITELTERPFEQISDGQRQRVMLARAICQEPDVLVLDEATTFLDVKHKIAFLNTLKALAFEKRIAVVISIHAIEDAVRIADSVMCIRNGKSDRYGKPEEVLHDRYIEELFDMEAGSYGAFYGHNDTPPREIHANVLSPDHTEAASSHYVRSGTKKLRMGYTTGTCAALAASAAVRTLLTGKAPARVLLPTPKGITVEVPVEACEKTDGAVMCAVKKDSGDDPDITNGCIVQATVTLDGEAVTVDGGEGVGRVTKPGLDRPVGDAAINTVPRRMIADAVEAVCTEEGYEGGVHVVISVPDGERLAKKTFNPALGVEGGISILGTSGIVEPMSTRALIDTIELEIRQAALSGMKRLVLTPGNIGEAFWNTLGIDESLTAVVRCSNFIGEALDAACACQMPETLVAGHTGKLVKLAGGIMQTHSRTADCRTELFCAHAALAGADSVICRRLMACVTTDACLDVLEDVQLADRVMNSLADAVERHLAQRAAQMTRTGAVLFSKGGERITCTANAQAMLADWKGQQP